MESKENKKPKRGQQSPSCRDGNPASDDGKPKDRVSDTVGNMAAGEPCQRVHSWMTGFYWFFKVKNQNTVYVAGIEVGGMKRPREPPKLLIYK